MDRRTLERQFSEPGPSPWKTFVVEAHPDGGSPADYLADVFGKGRVEQTEDVHLHVLQLDDDLRFTVDDLDGRFWSLHSTSPTDQAVREIRRRVTARRDLDFVWLPSHHLRQISPGVHPSYLKTDFRGWSMLPSGEIRDLAIAVRGRDADRLLDVIRRQKDHEHAVSINKLTVRATDPELGTVEEAVNRYRAVRRPRGLVRSPSAGRCRGCESVPSNRGSCRGEGNPFHRARRRRRRPAARGSRRDQVLATTREYARLHRRTVLLPRTLPTLGPLRPRLTGTPNVTASTFMSVSACALRLSRSSCGSTCSRGAAVTPWRALFPTSSITSMVRSQSQIRELDGLLRGEPVRVAAA